MRLSGFLLTSIFVAGLLTSACSSGNRVSSPSPVTPSQPNESVPPPTVDRGPNPAPPPSPPQPTTCDATKAQWAVGQRASNDLLERARNAAEAGVARFIRPNEAITMEFSPGRLNLGLDKRDVVIAVTCG